MRTLSRTWIPMLLVVLLVYGAFLVIGVSEPFKNIASELQSSIPDYTVVESSDSVFPEVKVLDRNLDITVDWDSVVEYREGDVTILTGKSHHDSRNRNPYVAITARETCKFHGADVVMRNKNFFYDGATEDRFIRICLFPDEDAPTGFRKFVQVLRRLGDKLYSEITAYEAEGVTISDIIRSAEAKNFVSFKGPLP